ncbi:MAG: beta galactosidase jelly roll domain-containing protein, partial [Terriglobia bacterium]
FSIGEWQPAPLGGAPANDAWLPAFCWTRAHFTLDPPTGGWEVTWNATIDADRDALLYLNGKFVGRYVTDGPQKQFYLPEPWINWDEGGSNILTVVLAYTDQPQHLKTLRIAPYDEFAAKRTRVEFRWR